MKSGGDIPASYRTATERCACVQEWLTDERTTASLDKPTNGEIDDDDETLTLYCPPYDTTRNKEKLKHTSKGKDQELEKDLACAADLSSEDEVPQFVDSRCDDCRQIRGGQSSEFCYSCHFHERRPRNETCRDFPGFIAIGGISSVDWECAERGGTAVWLYDLNNCEWTKLQPLPQPRHNFGSCELDDVIYVTGGIHPKPKPYVACPVDTTFILDPKVGHWCAGPPLTLPRSHHKMLSYKGTVWLLGGKDHDGRYLNYVEFLGGDCGQWMMSECLPFPVAGFCSAIYDGRIFVAGGVVEKNGSSKESKATMSLDKCRWCYEPNLGHGLFCACMEEVNGCLYILGGGKWNRWKKNQKKCLSCSSRIVSLNEGQREWVLVQHLRFPCYNMATVTIGTNLYILGGIAVGEDSIEVLNIVDCFDIETQQVNTTNISLPSPLASFGCVKVADVCLYK